MGKLAQFIPALSLHATAVAKGDGVAVCGSYKGDKGPVTAVGGGAGCGFCG